MTVTPKLDPTLARYRQDYPILESTTYMNSNSIGAMPAKAKEALGEYTSVWAKEGGEAWELWPQVVNETADAAARFFGAPAGQTTLNQNVAFFQASIASALDLRGDRNKVVIEELMFPNIIYVWERFTRDGGELSLVPSDDGMTIATERMMERIVQLAQA